MLAAPKDVDTVLHRVEDLLVPDRGDPVEVAIDEADGVRRALRCAIHVALPNGWQIRGVEDPARLFHLDGGSHEHDDVHDRVSRYRRMARRPGR